MASSDCILLGYLLHTTPFVSFTKSNSESTQEAAFRILVLNIILLLKLLGSKAYASNDILGTYFFN
jgi:hypothetical protein